MSLCSLEDVGSLSTLGGELEGRSSRESAKLGACQGREARAEIAAVSLSSSSRGDTSDGWRLVVADAAAAAVLAGTVRPGNSK